MAKKKIARDWIRTVTTNNTSLVLTIPKQLAGRLEIEKGMQLRIFERTDGFIVGKQETVEEALKKMKSEESEPQRKTTDKASNIKTISKPAWKPKPEFRRRTDEERANYNAFRKVRDELGAKRDKGQGRRRSAEML